MCISSPDAPDMPPPPPEPEKAVDAGIKKSRAKDKARALLASGRSSTLLTGGGTFRNTAQANLGTKTLLGQ